ncbi:hypothetical protein SBA3_1030004 [Candidatus Sulfopaludibacter sp. SbA3]|nr:hypothetical protein SBA3_1030004 [Candidatus Sulfopaludibacter sp. SbA3]
MTTPCRRAWHTYWKRRVMMRFTSYAAGDSDSSTPVPIASRRSSARKPSKKWGRQKVSHNNLTQSYQQLEFSPLGRNATV